MSRIFRTYFYIKILIDEFVIFFTFWATSIYFNPHTGINVFGASDYFLLFFLLFFWFIISKILPIYDDPGIRYFSLELTILVKAIIAQCIAISLIMFFIDEKRYDTRAFVCIYVVFSSVLLIIEKYALHFILKKIGVKGENIKKVLIVGAGQLGMAFYDKIVKEKKFGYQLVGFVDD